MPGERVPASVRFRIFFNKLDAAPNATTRESPPLRMPWRERCSLHWLRESLYLFSFLSSSGSALMLRHFTSHYFGALGVKPLHARFVVLEQHGGGGLADVLSLLLDEAHVPAANVRALRNVSYSDALKIDQVNEYILGLPMDAWLIFADSDEFFTYPCSQSFIDSVRFRRE